MRSSLAEKIRPTRHRDQFGHPVARRHQRLDPFDNRDTRTCRSCFCARFNRCHALAEPAHEFRAALGRVKSVGYALHVGKQIGECVWGERDYLRLRAQPSCNRFLDLGHAHRAHVALRLRDDNVGLEASELFCVDAVDRKRVGENRLDALIHLGA